jgi:hypothetical protein
MNHGNKRKKKATKTNKGLNRRWGVPDGNKLEIDDKFDRIKGLDWRLQFRPRDPFF